MSRLGSPASDAGRLFVSQLPEIDRVIAWVCARHHLTRADSEDFSSQVKLKLIEDDYAVFRKFQGRSSWRTYLSIVIQRLYYDFRTHAWGKWRPSAEAKRSGETAVLVEQLTIRDGRTLDETYEILTTNHGISMTRAALESLASRLPQRVRRLMESDAVLESRPSTLPPPDVAAKIRTTQSRITLVMAALRKAIDRLDVQDRLILRMRFDEGCSVPQIASVVGIDPKVLYRRLDRLIRNLRRSLEADGLHSSAIRDVLADVAESGSWAGESAGVSVHGD